MDKYINFNGKLINEKSFSVDLSNRALRFGDSIFETIRVFNGKVVFLHHHIARLFYSLDIVRMQLPDFFTSQYLNLSIIKLIEANSKNNFNARIRLTIFRKSSEKIYFINKNEISDFILEYIPLEHSNFELSRKFNYKIDVFEEIKKPSGILSQLKTNNVLLHSIAGSEIADKSLDNIILINENNCITEAVNANIFLVKENIIYTPKLEDGCVDGILRKVLIKLIKEKTHFTIIENKIDKSELNNCDEVFLTNSISGVQAVNNYKNIKYITDVSERLTLLIIKEVDHY